LFALLINNVFDRERVSEQMQTAMEENQLLQEEHDRLQQRHAKLTADGDQKERIWRERLS